MHGPSHLIISWFTAEAAGVSSPRERRIVVLSGFAPDIDVLAYLGAIVYFGFNKDLAFEHVWRVVHHRYTHGLGFVLLTGLLVFFITMYRPVSKDKAYRQASRVAILSMLASIIHLFSGLVAGGADWPIYPFWPISDFAWFVQGSGTLADWPNPLILFACLGGTMLYAKVAGYSPLESIHYKLDKKFVTIIQKGSLNIDSSSEDTGLSTSDKKHALRIRLTVYSLLILLILAVLAPLRFQSDQLTIYFLWTIPVEKR